MVEHNMKMFDSLNHLKKDYLPFRMISDYYMDEK